MSLRRSHRRARLGPLTLRVLAVLLVVLMLGVSSCAHRSAGFHHTLRPGENLYRVGLRYGVPASVIARVNGITDVTSVRSGTRLWIPRRGARPPARNTPPVASAPKTVAKSGDLRFIWPVRGRLTSRFGRRNGRPHEGIDLGASSGTTIRASESGRVIHSGRLGAYGKMVVVKHAGPYRTVYAHARTLHVRKGQVVKKGQKIAEVGSTGRSTGPHLHFEIRRGSAPRNPIHYLP